MLADCEIYVAKTEAGWPQIDSCEIGVKQPSNDDGQLGELPDRGVERKRDLWMLYQSHMRNEEDGGSNSQDSLA